MPSFPAEVTRICTEEWELFDRGKRKEYQKKVFGRIGDYWKKLGENHRDGRTDVNFGGLNKDDPNVIVPDARNKNPPWSAAFISFVAREAGAGNAFLFSGFHSKYILAALREAANPASTAKFIARRHKLVTPKVGDLIAAGRESAKNATFDTAPSFQDQHGFFPSHCDFVIDVDLGGRNVLTTGGNVGNSVGRKNWPLDASGHIGDTDPRSSSAHVICIINSLLP
ncbi:MAG: hypothetical protein QOH67_3509 [Hyphomicrobiales bacterium]|nr:hypothetical protein [Hyphomicrobiales bacterium]